MRVVGVGVLAIFLVIAVSKFGLFMKPGWWGGQIPNSGEYAEVAITSFPTIQKEEELDKYNHLKYKIANTNDLEGWFLGASLYLVVCIFYCEIIRYSSG